MAWKTTSEIQTALSINARGSLIPTEQLRELVRLASQPEDSKTEIARLRKALAFYADPESYFAVMVLGDRPCGGFAEDFSAVWWEPSGQEEEQPGKLARETLGDWETAVEEYYREYYKEPNA